MAALTERTVLVTGAFGNVGRYVLRGLEQEPVTVVATDVASDHHRELAQDWVAGAASQVRRAEWVDLTDAGAVARLVADTDPDVVLHLAGVIPPAAYRDPSLARAVNVEATAHLVAAVLAQPTPARVVFASSMATFGSRNPHRVGVATAQPHPPGRRLRRAEGRGRAAAARAARRRGGPAAGGGDAPSPRCRPTRRRCT